MASLARRPVSIITISRWPVVSSGSWDRLSGSSSWDMTNSGMNRGNG